MNMNTSRIESKFNGLLVATMMAIVVCAGVDAVSDEFATKTGAPFKTIAAASTADAAPVLVAIATAR